jgi:hypothetical protein
LHTGHHHDFRLHTRIRLSNLSSTLIKLRALKPTTEILVVSAAKCGVENAKFI